MNMKADQACTEPHGDCASLPELVRMNYFHGQLISDRDLRTEQDYFRAKLRHANRCLHGYGVLCGLDLRPVPGRADCPPVNEEQRRDLRGKIEEYEGKIETLRQTAGEDGANLAEIEADIQKLAGERETLLRELEAPGGVYPPAQGEEEEHRPKHIVELACGAAIDCEGNDIIVRQPVKVDLDELLKCAGDDEAENGAEAQEVEGSRYGARRRYVYLSICYQECGREPTRPFELDECATSIRCHDARVAEGWRLTASWRRPPEDERCETCCSACREACLLLARIRVDRNRPIRPEDIDHQVRRRFGLYDPTVIAGVSWLHGFSYSLNAADHLLGTNDENAGLEIRFSRPVRADTLTKGVVDLWRIEGGRGGRGESRNMEATLIIRASPDGLVDRFYITNSSSERAQLGDRLFVTVRTAFILDACCRAVEGAHLGGRVPRLPDDEEATRLAREEEENAAPPAGCVQPPHGPVPWTTGAGGNFESWFYIAEA